MQEKVRANKDELLNLVADLIKIPNINPGGDQLPAIAFVEKYLNAAGILTERVGDNPAFPSLIARIGEDSGFRLIANGHVDVVPVGDIKGWDFDPFCGTIDATTIKGRGTSDMKAGVAIIMFIMKLLKESGKKLNGDIRLHIVSDEETGGEYGTGWLCQNGYADGADACVVSEPTGDDNIEIGQKGRCHLILKASGVPAHGSIGNYAGDNAITKLSKVLVNIDSLTTVRGKFKDSQATALKNSRMIATKAIGEKAANAIDHLTANVGIINGGTKLNMVPDYCEAHVDMRLPIGILREDIVEAVEALIDRSGAQGVEAEYIWGKSANYTDDDTQVVKVFHKYGEQILGTTILPAYQWASSDAEFYRSLGIPTIQFGPANLPGIHSYNEDVDIEQVIRMAEVYMLAFCEMLEVD